MRTKQNYFDLSYVCRLFRATWYHVQSITFLHFLQIVIWFIIPATRSPRTVHKNNALALIVLLQYIPRLYLIFPLSAQIVKATGVVTKTAWAGAAYNLLLYMLASHVIYYTLKHSTLFQCIASPAYQLLSSEHIPIHVFYYWLQVLGAAWYLLSVDRYMSCWKLQCRKELGKCIFYYLDCDSSNHNDRVMWTNTTNVFSQCDPENKVNPYDYGIFEDAVKKNVVSSEFFTKYFYCLWWGLQQLR